MSEGIDSFDAAVSALTDAVNGSEGSGTPDYGQPSFDNSGAGNQPNIADPNPQGDQGANQGNSAQDAPNFLDSKSIDLNQLAPEAREFLQAREREMQAAFTRKTQELAAERQQAQQAVQFINELNTNPEFALEVHSRLSSELQNLGYSVHEANAAANQALGNDAYEVDDPYLAKINELEQWKNQQEQRMAEAQAEARIHAETAAIRSENPSFTDADMDDIYRIAVSMNGNLAAATNAFKSLTQRSVERYLNQKTQIPVQLQNQPGQSGFAQQLSTEKLDLGDKQLRAAAMERLRAAGFE